MLGGPIHVLKYGCMLIMVRCQIFRNHGRVVIDLDNCLNQRPVMTTIKLIKAYIGD